jgi:peptidoglycan/LPS O-acetylase OafA/YrhL
VAVTTRPGGAHRAGDPPVRPSVRGRSFRPDIQGLRALAVGMVVVYHLYPHSVRGGFAGVDVFFVISGYLITSHLYRGWQRTGRVHLLDFWGRRARRLLPAAALVLAVTWLLSREWLPATQLPATVDQIRASALYYQNWVLAHDAVDYLTSAEAASPVQHFWSLSVEEQFYLFWPWLFLLAAAVGLHGRRRAGRVTAVVLAGVVFVASLAYSAYYTGANPAAAYFVTTTRIWELALGGLVAILPGRIAARLARQGWLAWAGLVMVAVSAFELSGSSAFPGTVALWPVAGTALLLVAGSHDAVGGPARLTSLRPFVFLGDVSYSLYLWHWPLIVIWKAYSGGGIGLLDGPAIAVVSVLLAWLTKVFVEDTVRTASFVTARPWRSLATVVTVLVPVGLVAATYTPPPVYHVHVDNAHPGALALASPSITVPSAPPQPTPAQAPQDFVGGGGGNCQTPIVSTPPRPCVLGVTSGYKLTVALIGDSVADQWRSAILVLAAKYRWRLITGLHGECPWTATMTAKLRTDQPYVRCHNWGKLLLTSMVKTYHPDVVITSARPVLGTPTHSTPDPTSFGQIAAGMVTYWKALAAHGTRVVAIRESPEPRRDVPACLTKPGAKPQDCATPVSRAIVEDSPLQQAVAQAGSFASLVDMDHLICAPTTCDPIVGNVVVYRDTHHLTETYIRTLRPYLFRRLLATGAFTGRHWH